ncbi:MAG: hypothetical protein MUO27_06940 [Sedimentisphaerales bacterium]|nr:hypothetical protein [Sedimentisphaerales bacterium]
MKVALGQFNATVGDLPGNTGKILNLCEQAACRDADLIVFPELAVCGYPPEDLLLNRHFLEDNLLMVRKIAAGRPDRTVIVGFAESHRGNTYNSAAILQGGRIGKIYRKGALPKSGGFDEQKYFQPGNEPVVIHLKRQWAKPEKTAKQIPNRIEQRFFPETRVTAFRLAA